MMLSPPASLSLFGGQSGWNEDDWTASDDRVRGGRSKSCLTSMGNCANFHGHLDIDTLGGAGFASQRTTAEQRHWDLSAYDGIELLCDTQASDSNRYTFILKDELPTSSMDAAGEKSTVSWEFDFRLQPGRLTNRSHLVIVEIPWTELQATYRGREVANPRPLRLEDIRRFSVMMRSFFGSQSGDFKLQICEIRCMTKQQSYFEPPPEVASNCDNSGTECLKMIEDGESAVRSRKRRWTWLLGCMRR